MFFTDEERGIFRYHDGTRDRFADPMVVWRKVNKLYPGDELQALQQMARNEDPGLYLPALGKLAELGYEAFGLQPLDPEAGTGLPERAALAVLNAFFRWENAEKKDAGPSPSSSPSTAGPREASEEPAPACVSGTGTGSG